MAVQGKALTITKMMLKKESANVKDLRGNTPMHMNFFTFDENCLISVGIGDLLIKAGANCNLSNKEKWTPIHFSCMRD